MPEKVGDKPQLLRADPADGAVRQGERMVKTR
jgi:hypothetical protein